MLAKRRTKIVATAGPSIASKELLKSAIEAGLNVVRLNFSHGTHADHRKIIQWIRELSVEIGAPVAILQDLQGPKIRVGRLEGGAVELVEGRFIKIDVSQELGNQNVLSTDFKELPLACKVGTHILLDDGLMKLEVTEVGSSFVNSKIIYGGTLKERKGMNLPGANLPIDPLTEKDLKDLYFGLDAGVDYIALSFVRTADDMKRLRNLVNEKKPDTRLIAKIEMLEALENLEQVIAESDAVMVARGDLAIEVGAAQMPQIQKQIISVCNELGRPVITATQMLDSMVESPTPTRAEITDVANAVLDGSDALMLSAETASGKYPTKCIQTMHEIILEVEKSGGIYYDISLDQEDKHEFVAETIGAGASLASMKLQSPVIVCLSTTGRTAGLIAKFRPRAQIIACTYKMEALNRLELVWGIQTIKIPIYESDEEAIQHIESLLVSYGLVKPGESVVLTLGMPIKKSAKTNTMRVFEVSGDSALKTITSVPLRFKN